MRRKTPPIALARRSGPVRALRPAVMASFLPTAASIAMALGCSAPTVDSIVADPTYSVSVPVSAAPAPSPAPSPYVDPEPHPLPGKMPMVKHLPPPTTAKTK